MRALLIAALAAAVVPLGHSVDGRPIRALVVGSGPRNVLVVGCIHGNECAGVAVVRALARAKPPTGSRLWLVPTANPDGRARGTRGNARGVDLNRNFPWHWRPLRGIFYSGPRPFSEPESRALARLVLRLHPAVSIWFHQHMALVDESGGSAAVERRFARLVGLPLRRIPHPPGSVTSWQNSRFPGTTAFVVELPPGPLPVRAVGRYTRAVLAVAAG